MAFSFGEIFIENGGLGKYANIFAKTQDKIFRNPIFNLKSPKSV
jgi:hypothetical protein